MGQKEDFEVYIKKLPSILVDTGITEIIPKAHTQYIESSLKAPAAPFKTKVPGNLKLIASSLESFACDLYIHSQPDDAYKLFEEAFICRRNLLAKESSPPLDQLFYFAVSALGCKRASELRLTLVEQDIPSTAIDEDWPNLVQFNIIRAFLLLCRKNNGWSDIRSSLEAIGNLRQLQKQFEEKFLADIENADIFKKITDIGRLIAMYNLAKIIEISGTYMINGEPSNPNIKLKKHYENALEALVKSGDSSLEHFIDMVFVGSELLVNNSIWSHTGTLGKQIRDFVKELASEARTYPFIELWPSQQNTMNRGFFDFAKRSIVLQMPTSAGKTLMAEFVIVQTHALNPDSTIVYVVPTRALVNQVTLQLRRDFNPLGLITEAAVPVFEIDPTESELLQKTCNILVSTPEKIELLIRAKHPIVKDISLVIADEVHNLSDPSRGANLELMLGTVAREQKDKVRFLLLSPFIPNSKEVGEWLGEDRNTPIRVDWKPSERITAAALYKGKKSKRHIELLTLPSAHNSDVREEISIPIESIFVKGNKSKANVALSAAISIINKGGVLLLCSGRESAVNRAKEAMAYLPEIEHSELLKTTIDFAKDELGENHVLSQMLIKGIAFHHAGLSHETRYLIERLVERGEIKLVCATTTLAQGVNFPIRTVVVEGITRYVEFEGHKPIPYHEFWNIAGRAGRAMKDHIGLVIFAARNNADIQVYKNYLQGDARNVLSSILNDLENITDLSKKFDRKFVIDYPALSRFFQYLLHAITVSDYKTIASEMEDVLRSSLVYHQVSRDNPLNARKLIQLARRYLELVKGKADNKPFLELIDGTGFSEASVNFLWACREDFSNIAIWDSSNLFSLEDANLRKMIDVLSGIPELTLARFRKGTLDTDAISKIIKRWVAGASIEEIANEYFDKIEDRDERILQASRYIHNILVGQLAWGMSALQKVSLFGKEDVEWQKIGHVPALMYYGVASKEAVTLRMLGVPRPSAEKLSQKYTAELAGKSLTFQQIREWLNSAQDSDWEDAKGKSKMTGKAAKFVWKTLNGLV